MSLTCGERFMRCLTGQPIDRVPFGVGIGWAPWGETYERWKVESGDPALDVGKTLGFDLSCAGAKIYQGLWPEFAYEVLEKTDDYITARDGRGIVMRNRRDMHSMPLFLEHPVKDQADWTRIKTERLRVDDPSRVAEDWPAFRRRMQESGEAVQVGWFPYGVFGTPRDLMGAEEVLMAFYTDPEMIEDMMTHLTDVWLAVWERVAAETQIGHIHIWEDMSGRQGSLISPAMVKAFMMPCYDRIAAFAQAHGVRVVSVDTDGDCAELVPIMMEHGVNTFFPFEVAAGNDIEAYRRQYPTLGIIGGLDKRALAAGKAEIDREVEKAARMVKHGRYIPAFDHLIPPDVPWENFVYAAEQTRKLCGG